MNACINVNTFISCIYPRLFSKIIVKNLNGRVDLCLRDISTFRVRLNDDAIRRQMRRVRCSISLTND